MAGYSKKPLVEKLGILPGFRVSFENEPAGYLTLLAPLPEAVDIMAAPEAELDFLQLFATDRLQLSDAFSRARGRIKPAGMIWVSWPKQTSPRKGDLNESIVQEIGLASKLVDVKVAAIDEDWSALKFVIRLQHRPQIEARGG